MRWLFLILLVTGSTTLLAQTSGQLEFTVSDTVNIRPDKIVYVVSIQSVPNYEMGMDNPVDDYKLKETEERFIKICNKLNFHPEVYTTDAKYRINKAMAYEIKSVQYRLEFKSEAQLEKLHAELKDIESIVAGVLENKVTPEREAAARQKLLAKIKAKANTEAQLLAKAFDKTVGSLVSVTFQQDYAESFSMYPGFKDSDVYYGYGFKEEALHFTLHQTVSFKFEMK